MAYNAGNSSSIRREAGACDTQGRLIKALSALWLRHSQAEISVRMIAREADASVSAIDYHFGSLEQLFVHAQHAALMEASAWMNGVFEELRVLPLDTFPMAARASLLASLIEQWTCDQRSLALAWREAHAAVAANPALCEPHRQWTTLWRNLWSRLCREVGFFPNEELLALFFDGEASQHLIRWHRLLDRALLDETVAALFHFVEPSSAPSSVIRVQYQDLAERQYREAFGAREEFTAIDAAAAAILAEEGLASLTFRSVARRADSTLGAVSYHFGSKSKMLRLALQGVYEGSSTAPTLTLIDAMPSDPEAATEAVIESVIGGHEPLLRALDEVILNLSRDEGDRALCGVIRGFRDPVGGALLAKFLGENELTSPSLVAVFSSVVRGFGHWGTGLAEEDARDLARTALRIFR
ncbi:TetR/AcrR family transcriptional regulator [Altererythrobacter sp. CC-YST694]|uniref:TetR/AcrR family transcriptional regulator n=1 Tax=Altererythrobacter sp. CC-YST694 TaxID=2755038 RepID=UPI001D0328E8|nr:TetR/AcrR family transcriptional regulator [Altererythrobacter sp. CC-YST694]MCB5425145.1 TetR/AcrR family transcriptional regulator [Altererythrobacter sp. CC-YST694]